MTMTVQFDLFNAMTPIASFDWADKTNINIFEYNDDIKFDDVTLVNNYIIDVPCYKIEDIEGLIDSNDDIKSKYFSLVRNKKLNHCLVRITDKDRYSCGDKWFVLANAKTRKFVEQQTLFAMLKGNMKKKPRLYKKVIQIESTDYRKDLKTNFVQAYTLSKWHTQHVLEQL